ncbi:hypothetical protein PILCRDRAFT_172634 [Piloderma croceum F 1598]|uniref:Uncharacterized protein n=1 Tax=Piloderma croceum (strain F 1598) TaxID=765440 RepID=A0A0C3GEL8_PILCF|nr:hypothetical protein PILCRDRAFT_172634 [Piloderma croceum F 1598]
MFPSNQVPPEQLGQGLIGLVFGLGIYGVTLAQTFLYYRRFPDDAKGSKYLVFFLTVIDTFHTYLVCSIVWSTTVIGRIFEPTTLIPIPWSV